jgi:hypothetical protein
MEPGAKFGASWLHHFFRHLMQKQCTQNATRRAYAENPDRDGKKAPADKRTRRALSAGEAESKTFEQPSASRFAKS